MRGAGPAGSPGRSQRTASLPHGGGYSRLGPHVLKKVRTGGAAAKTRAERHDTAREERAVRVQARGPHEGEPRLAGSCGARRFRGLPDALASPRSGLQLVACVTLHSPKNPFLTKNASILMCAYYSWRRRALRTAPPGPGPYQADSGASSSWAAWPQLSPCRTGRPSRRSSR